MPESYSMQPGKKLANGRFVLVHALGRGGMGEVWLALDERLQEQVALKFLPPEVRGHQDALHDLGRETARSHRLSHPNIVRIHDLHEDQDGMAFIVMEFIDGSTLSALRRQQPSAVLSWDYLRPLVEQLCAALEYAHSEHVIHRDLKPANIMVDGKGRLKLADFGIAAVMSESASRVSRRRLNSGTLPYMSPQQLNGEHPKPGDDIYALGATIYELLTGKPPFYMGDITHQVINKPPEPMQERLAAFGTQNEIPGEVAALTMSCLAKEPEQRPQSARAVAEWIGLDAVRESSIDSPRKGVFSNAPPAPSEIEKSPPAASSSRKMPLWAVGGFVVLLMLAAGGSYWAKRMKKSQPMETNIPHAPAEPASAATITTQVVAPIVEIPTSPVPPASGLGQNERWTFTTIAGEAGSAGAADGIGGDARFNLEAGAGITLDPLGNLYIVDGLNNTIRIINPAGHVSTLAGLAGTGASADGMGTSARFLKPRKIALDRSSNLYVSCFSSVIRKITPSGMVTTFAGKAGSVGKADGPVSIARFGGTFGIAVAPDGSIFVADEGNHTIRKITPGGVVSTLTSVHFAWPFGLAIGRQGIIYVTDSRKNTIHAITPNRLVSTLAGEAGTSGSADGVKGAARFDGPRDIQVDDEGNLYVADFGNNTIRKITSAGAVTTVGGLAGEVGSIDGTGADARFNGPAGLALDHEGNIYVADTRNNTIRKGHRQ